MLSFSTVPDPERTLPYVARGLWHFYFTYARRLAR